MGLRKKRDKLSREKRLAAIRKHLRDGTLPTYRNLAEELGVTVSTVHADVATVKAEPPLHEAHGNLFNSDDTPKAGAEVGNLRGVTHGATSDRLIVPRAEEVARMVIDQNPHLHPTRDHAAVMRYGSTLARIERVYEWLDTQPDSIFTNSDGQVSHPVYGRLERWEVTAERAETALGITPAARVALGMPVDIGDADKRKCDLSILTDYELSVWKYLIQKSEGEDVRVPNPLQVFMRRWLDDADREVFDSLMKRIEAREQADWRPGEPDPAYPQPVAAIESDGTDGD